MNHEPKFESKENKEEILIKVLKEKGLEDAEAKTLLVAWTQEQEKIAEAQTGDAYHVAQIELNLKIARLLYSAGLLDEAYENFEAALMYAENENRLELVEAIEKEMRRLEEDG